MARVKSLIVASILGLVWSARCGLNAQTVETNGGSLVQTRYEDGTPIAGSPSGNLGFHPPPGLKLSVSVVTGYDDNVNTSSAGGSGSFYTTENVALSYFRGNSRSTISVSTGGGITDYFSAGRGIEPTGFFALSLRHNLNHRLTLNVSALASYQAQPDVSTDLGSNQNLGSFFHSTDTISVENSWTHRFSTTVSYSLGILKYDSSAGALQDRQEQTFAQQLRYLLWPTSSGLFEYRYEIIDYDTAPMDSTTHFLLLGIDHSLNPHLNASLRGGVELRSAEDDSGGPGPFFESTLNYIFRIGTISWMNRYSIEESGVPGAAAQQAFRTGLTFGCKFSRRFSGDLAFFYIHDGGGNQSNSSVTQDTLDVGPTLHYMISRRLNIDLGMHYTNVESGNSFGSYSHNNYFARLSFAF